jgi:hypothetical protein
MTESDLVHNLRVQLAKWQKHSQGIKASAPNWGSYDQGRLEMLEECITEIETLLPDQELPEDQSEAVAKDPFRRYTDRSRKVMQLANQEAKKHIHGYIGTAHVLLGITRVKDSVAARALVSLGADLYKIRKEVKKHLQAGPTSVSISKLPMDAGTRDIVWRADAMARVLGHHYVGTEHILLGLLEQQSGLAAEVLTGFGVTLEAARKAVLDCLKS